MKIGGSVYWDVGKSVGAVVDRDVGGEVLSGAGSVGWDVGRIVVTDFVRDILVEVGCGYCIDRDVGDVVGIGCGGEFELELGDEVDPMEV